jgi:sulfonate transport system permease protein
MVRAGFPSVAWRRGMMIPCALILLWGVVGSTGLIDRHFLVPLQRVALVPFLDPDGSTVWLDLAQSVTRMVAGFAIGAGAGLLLGGAMGLSRFGQRLIGPSFTAVRQVTVFAWIPLLTAWFGNGEESKLVFIALSALFPMALHTQQGLRDVPVHYLELAQVLRLSPGRRFTQMLLPSALPAIFVGIEIALISAWIGTVGAEYAMGFGRGIGIFLSEGREQFRMDIVIVGVIALAVVGFLINVAARSLFGRLAPWHGNQS